MKSFIPYTIIGILLIAKIFAWWLLIWGSNILDAELTLKGMFEPIHAFSYMVLSSVLLIGLLFGSRFSLIALAMTAPINLSIYLMNENVVYQSIWDPVLVSIFIAVVVFRNPNKWNSGAGVNKSMGA